MKGASVTRGVYEVFFLIKGENIDYLALVTLKTAVSGEQLNFGKHSTGRLQQKVLESQELSGIGRFKSLFR